MWLPSPPDGSPIPAFSDILEAWRRGWPRVVHSSPGAPLAAHQQGLPSCPGHTPPLPPSGLLEQTSKASSFPGRSTPVPNDIKPLPSPKGSFKIKAAKGRRCLCPQTSLPRRGAAGTEPCAPGRWLSCRLGTVTGTPCCSPALS